MAQEVTNGVLARGGWQTDDTSESRGAGGTNGPGGAQRTNSTREAEKPGETNRTESFGYIASLAPQRQIPPKFLTGLFVEGGHSSGPTRSPEQQQFDAAVKAREDAIAKNKEIEAFNAPILAQTGELETKLNCLDRLLNHIDAKGDGVLTWEEINHLAMNSGVQEVRDAANWLLANRAVYESLPKRRTTFGGEDANGNPTAVGGTGAGRLESAPFLAQLRAQISALRSQLKPSVDVPQLPNTQSNAQTGGSSSQNAGGASNNQGVGGATNGGSAGSAEGTKAPGDGATENYDKVGKFSSDATTSEGRLADGLNFLQRGYEALQEDLLKASTENPPNQAKITRIQNKLQQVQNALTAMMQMMKQFQEMMTNVSKMYSEMAMTAIRNMR